MILIDTKSLQELKMEIADAVVQSLKSSMVLSREASSKDDWVDTSEAKRILGYRSKTKMQNMRDSKSIAFSKFGRKIKYNRQSLIDFIEKNKIN
jgi:hypothetical protein